MEALRKLKATLIDKIYSDLETDRMLNYLTLNIREKEIQQDLIKYTIQQKIRIFWPVMIFVVAQFISTLLTRRLYFQIATQLINVFWLVIVQWIV